MLDAHMDEVGFMIVADDGEGLYRFETIGGIDVRHLVGKAGARGERVCARGHWWKAYSLDEWGRTHSQSPFGCTAD